MKKKFNIITLGCRTNQYESQAYRKQLEAVGYTEAASDEEAELCIVNSCTVTASADSRSRAAIRNLKRRNPKAKILVTGCYAEQNKKEIEKIAPGTVVVPNEKKEQLLEGIVPEELPEFTIDYFSAHTRAFVKVQDGCNSFCTYCIIPYVRGRSRSRTIASVVEEVKGLIANGYKEVVLTGVNIGDFDGQGEGNLAALVREVDQIPGLKRLRLSSIDPDEVDDELLSAIVEGKTTCASMHIVLQSGSNYILKRMNRKYTRQMFLQTVERLRAASPDFTFTTDIIIAFPGESEQDFMDTLQLIEEVQFAKVHSFPYSSRPRTRAALYKDHVPADEVAHRKQKILRTQEKAAFALREKFVGRTMPVLLEQSEEGLMCGHTDNFLMVYMKDTGLAANDLVHVKITKNTPQGLFGEVV